VDRNSEEISGVNGRKRVDEFVRRACAMIKQHWCKGNGRESLDRLNSGQIKISRY